MPRYTAFHPHARVGSYRFFDYAFIYMCTHMYARARTHTHTHTHIYIYHAENFFLIRENSCCIALLNTVGKAARSKQITFPDVCLCLRAICITLKGDIEKPDMTVIDTVTPILRENCGRLSRSRRKLAGFYRRDVLFYRRALIRSAIGKSRKNVVATPRVITRERVISAPNFSSSCSSPPLRRRRDDPPARRQGRMAFGGI